MLEILRRRPSDAALKPSRKQRKQERDERTNKDRQQFYMFLHSRDFAPKGGKWSAEEHKQFGKLRKEWEKLSNEEKVSYVSEWKHGW
eukprot:GFYU01000060.1.p1 GENE.GFYU01000060.1~~GFYU01000060.1.p1  ORF type:complete len:101 (-),score=17.72 GFYU01000060.1:452-712(-)